VSAAGLVSLVGAGPGAADLITVRGLDRLRRADVVLYDRLVSARLLDEAPASALRISVAKAPGGPAVPQEEINRQIVAHARAGRRVVRLKGGDPFLFGRGGEELLACAREGIPCEIVPGVSSALAAPGAAGIPVTHRHLAATLTIITGHRAPEVESDSGESGGQNGSDNPVDWSMAARADTLVVLMGVARLDAICAALIEEGKPPTTPAAVIERATLPRQRTLRGTLATLPTLASEAGIATPAVTVVGAVVAVAAEAAEVLEAAAQLCLDDVPLGTVLSGTARNAGDTTPETFNDSFTDASTDALTMSSGASR
jgi:uroporphyrin-III C-methyltransferase